MNCADFEKRLNDDFEPSGLAESVDLDEHARHCADCRPMWDRFLVLSESISLWREELPEIDLAEAVVNATVTRAGARRSPDEDFRIVVPAVPQTHSSPRSDDVLPLAGIVARSPELFAGLTWGRGALALAALGLTALVVVTVILPARRNSRDEMNRARLVNNSAVDKVGNPAPVAGPEPVVAPEMDPDPANPQVADVAPNRDAYYDLARKAAGALGMATVSLIPGAPPQMPPSDPLPESGDGWIDGLQQQLQPIGRSVGDAFDFLWQAGRSADG